jgi:two-component system cell cycle sensor histidine kinase/response regulator CckA
MQSDDAAPRILVVDDDASVREFTARVLQTAGYDVVIASNGTQALELVERRGSFDGFVVEVVMPEMSGTVLGQELRRVDPDAKILYFTGFSDTLFGDNSTLGAHEAFVDKPFTIQGLLEAVSLLLHGNLRHADQAHRPGR